MWCMAVIFVMMKNSCICRSINYIIETGGTGEKKLDHGAGRCKCSLSDTIRQQRDTYGKKRWRTSNIIVMMNMFSDCRFWVILRQNEITCHVIHSQIMYIYVKSRMLNVSVWRKWMANTESLNFWPAHGIFQEVFRTSSISMDLKALPIIWKH